MNVVQRLEFWGEHHHPKWIDLLRIALGVFLCFRGISFATHMGELMNLMTGSMPFSTFILVLIGHYVVFAHIMGGFLLAVGLLTRMACIIQIPILMGAIIFGEFSETLKPFSDALVSVIVLVLLIYFFIIGSGPWSLDKAFEKTDK